MDRDLQVWKSQFKQIINSPEVRALLESGTSDTAAIFERIRYTNDFDWEEFQEEMITAWEQRGNPSIPILSQDGKSINYITLPVTQSPLSTETRVSSTGFNHAGQAGFPESKIKSLDTPTVIPELSNITQIASGERHTLCLDKTGRVYAFGINNRKPYLDYGQLGLGDMRYVTDKPVLIEKVKDIAYVACGENHSIFVDKSGQVFGCGNNDSNRIGFPNEESVKLPTRIPGLKDIVMASCGGKHSIFLDSRGNVYGAGSNFYGELGLGENIRYVNGPTLIPTLKNIMYIACGREYTVFIDGNRHVFACGSNSHQQLGFQQKVNFKVPVQIPDLSNIVHIAAGSTHTMFIDLQGNLIGCGSNLSGELGIADNTIKSTPLILLPRLIPDATIKSIACGSNFTIFLSTDGRIYSCGSNDLGELGVSKKMYENVYSPLLLESIKNVEHIACGESTTFFIHRV